MWCSHPMWKNDWNVQFLFSNGATEKRLENPRTDEKHCWPNLNGTDSKMNEWQKTLLEIAALIDARESIKTNCGDHRSEPSGPTSVSAAIRTVVKDKVVGQNDGSK